MGAAGKSSGKTDGMVPRGHKGLPENRPRLTTQPRITIMKQLFNFDKERMKNHGRRYHGNR
jgi:hypothetical protein